MDVESGSLEPESTKDEPDEDIKIEEIHGEEPSPSKKPRTSPDPAAASCEGESGSVEPESSKDLGGDSKNLPKISDEDVQEAMKKQGIWRDQSTHIDPQDLDLARKASSAPDASKASEINDECVSGMDYVCTIILLLTEKLAVQGIFCYGRVRVCRI